jgi:transcriptional regulator of arginine metabolism
LYTVVHILYGVDSSVAMKPYRQSVLLEVIEREAITSQEQLRARLQQHGIRTTQATLSRDIRDLGLIKQASDGSYRKPAAPQAGEGNGATLLADAVGEYLRRQEAVAQMLVLKTDAGQAQPLAIALDRADLREVVGTIAGDDTILVICRTVQDAEALAQRLTALRIHA